MKATTMEIDNILGRSVIPDNDLVKLTPELLIKRATDRHKQDLGITIWDYSQEIPLISIIKSLRTMMQDWENLQEEGIEGMENVKDDMNSLLALLIDLEQSCTWAYPYLIDDLTRMIKLKPAINN